MMTNLLNGAHVANKLFSTIARLRLLLVMFLTLTVSAEVWGETWTWTCSGTTVFSTSGSSLNGVTWKASVAGSSAGTGVSGEKCVQIAKNTGLTLETTGFNNKNIASISIQTWGSQGNTFYLKDGNTQLKSTTIPTSYTSNGSKISFSDVGVIGTKLVFNWASATKAFNVRSITITYEDAAPSCTVKPTVGTTLQSVTVTENSINATIPISSIGGCDITENGLVYSTTNATPTVDGSGCYKVTTTACGSIAANKTVTITGLICGQSYYIRGYAINGAGTSYTNVSTESTSDCPKYTVTLKDDNSTLTQITAGGSVTLPPREGCKGYTFAGWTKSWKATQTSWTTTAPDIISAGSYTPTADEALYPVYTQTKEEEGEPEEIDLTISPNDFELQTSNYESGKEYTATIDDITFGGHYITFNSTGTPSNSSAKEYIQLQKNNGNLYNITAFSGCITQIKIIQNGSANFSLYGGVEQLLASTNTATGQRPDGDLVSTMSDATITWDISDKEYTYFCIKKANTGTGYISSITITYLTASGTTTTTSYISSPDCGITQPSVTLNPNGGDFDPKPSGWTQEGENYKKEGVTGAITLPTPTRTGYDFKGWYDAASGGTEIADGGEDYTPSEDIVLYAQWDPITYTIRLNPGSGSCDNNQISGTYSEGVTLPTAYPSNACTEEGWTFAGWATASVNETITAPTTLYDANQTYNPTTNIELYAVYVKQTFTLSLVDNSTTYYVGGYESSKSILTAETDVNNAMDFRIVDGQYLRCESGYISHNSASSTNISCYPSKDGNVFPWTITENTGTISFQSTKAEGNIRYLGYNYNGGNPRFAVYVESYAHNFTKNTTTTYTTDPNCCTQLAEITGLTFSAMTRSITVSVPDSYDNTNVDGYIFNLYNAATGGVATTYDTNDKNEKSHTFTGLTPNTAYHFTIIAKGSGAYCNSEETSPRESYTTLPQYTVTWNPAGGNWSGSTADKVDTYDYQAEITKPADPERTGYTFNGWNTTPETIMPAENLTYTAQWNIVTYTITYENLNGATHTNPKDYTVETAPIALTDPTERAGYVFAGWYSDANYTTKVTQIPQGSTGNITLYAKWLEIFTITWMVNGKVSSTTEVVEGEPITPPASPDAGDYCGQVFVGWTNAEMAETTNVAPTLYPTPTPFPTATKETPTTFYAVFADYDEQQ